MEAAEGAGTGAIAIREVRNKSVCVDDERDDLSTSRTRNIDPNSIARAPKWTKAFRFVRPLIVPFLFYLPT